MRVVARVRDATLVGAGQPVHVVLSGLDDHVKVAAGVRAAGGTATAQDGRLDVVARPSQLVDAAGRAGGAALAEPLRAALEDAIEAWGGVVPDVPTPAGVLRTSQRPVVMGIVNVTPDSFSDGGRFDSLDAALARARKITQAGAHLIDIGGESTRPGATPVSAEDEIERVVPVIEAITAELDIPVSIDTMKPEVMRAAVAAGAAMINDVNALRAPGAVETAAELKVPVCLMHMQGEPRTMQQSPEYEDLVEDLLGFFRERIDACEQAGICRQNLILDPGFGFGKSLQHNLTLLAELHRFTELGLPILAGISRKSMLGRITGRENPEDRVAASLTAAVLATERGATILRVHDVTATVDAVKVVEAVRNCG